jgi:hypothetical protein
VPKKISTVPKTNKVSAENEKIKVPKKSAETGGHRHDLLNFPQLYTVFAQDD